MKYVRNSGRNKKKDKPRKNLTNEQKLTIQQQTEVGKKLKEEIQWLNELESLNKFSSEWVHKVAVELLFQCMGKKDIVMGFKGKEQLVRVFREKPALEALSMIAKMNGHLFDTVKGTIKQTGTIEHDHQHTIELKPDANRTVEVFEILEACGVVKPETKQISHSEMGEVYPA